MVIVELVGCPGVGKSVLCSKVAEELETRGYKVFKQPREWIRFKKLRLAIQNVSLYKSKIRRQLIFNGKRQIPNLDDPYRERWFKTVILLIKYIETAEKQGMDFLLMDEGCIQAITSIDHGKEMSPEVLCWAENVFQSVYLSRKVKLVSCELDMEENLRRLKERAREGDRFLAEDDRITIDNINLKKKNLEEVVKRSNCNISKVSLTDSENACNAILDMII